MINCLLSKTAETFRDADYDSLEDIPRVKVIEAPNAKADGCSDKVQFCLWVAFLIAYVVAKETTSSIEDRSKHNLIDGDFKDESLCHRWDFTHFENFYLADPIEEEDLSEDKNQYHWLKLAVEDSMHDVGKDEGVSFFNGELRCFIEGVDTFH